MATELDNLVVKIEADLSKLKNGLKNANRATQNASKSMSANFKNLGKRLDRIGLAALKVGTALGGVFAGYQIKRVIDVGRQVEDLGLRFNALFGSVEEGAKAFEVMKNFAAGVPFSFEEIQRASGNLAVVADDAEDLDTTAHTYDYNAVVATAPSAVGEVAYDNITFTNGADMDSVVAGDYFILRVTRDPTPSSGTDVTGDASLHAIYIKET